MPMNFPDMESLILCAEIYKFRRPGPIESEEDYREALANHVESKDFIESCEIRNKVGWDKFTKEQNRDMVRRNDELVKVSYFDKYKIK